MKLYDSLRYGSALEVSRLIDRIRSTDEPVDLTRFTLTHSCPSKGIHTPHITPLCSEHIHNTVIGHPLEKPPSPLPYYEQTITQTDSADLSLDPNLHLHLFESPYQPNLPAPRSASSQHEVLGATCSSSDSSRGGRAIVQAIPRQLCPEIDQSAARRQSTCCSPPAIQLAQDPTLSSLLVPGATHQSPQRSNHSAFAASPIAMQNTGPPGGHEDVISEYILWQTRRVCTEEWRSQFSRAGEILLEQGFRLKLFYQTKPIHLLLEGGVSKGIALSFHSDIPHWVSDFCHDSRRYHW